MSHMTADLEYFKCDMCGVYLHKDVFCNHRRECKGLNSTELKKTECHKIEAVLSANTRHLLESRLADEGKPVVPIELAERQHQARIRRDLVNSYESEIDKKLRVQLAPEKMKALADFLAE